MSRLEQHSTLARLYALQLEVFPEHEDFLKRRLNDQTSDHLRQLDELAELVERIAGGNLRQIAVDYAWLANVVLEEEFHFRRHGRYRLSTFAEANEQIYSDPVYMHKYMNGLLMSLLWWANHSSSVMFYRKEFLAHLPEGAAHLEVGPGHGLLLYLAAQSPADTLTGWDVSATSLKDTRNALDDLRIGKEVALEQVDLFDAPTGQFDSLTFSEVLEHLEEPLEALKILRGLLKPGAKIFVNAPVNSPAPDHLYLFGQPEEIVYMVEQAGFRVDKTAFFPATGATLERARKFKLAISTIVIGTAV